MIVRLQAAFLGADVSPAAFGLTAASAVSATTTAAVATTATAAVAASAATTVTAATTAAVAAATAAAVATATAATTGTTAERAATATASAGRAILGRVHAKGAAAQVMSVEFLDRLRRILIRFELDEREPAGPARLAIGRKKHVSYRSDLRKQRFDLVARCVEVEIPYENLGSHQHLLFCG
jgi:hypothetical protein